MIYSLTLGSAFAVVGIVLVVLGLVALWKRAAVQPLLRALPRSRPWGYALLAVVTAWSWYLILTIDLGEFDNWRPRVLIFIPIAAFLTARYVDELLAARALGMIFLLAAEPLLEAAFLQPQLSRLFLVGFVYLCIVVGMFWIGMPYLMRDAIGWLTLSERRWNTGALASIAYGVVLLVCWFSL
ncbi:MAG TPA: hypothetical protein VGO11_06185 [Chthoniobacteraceae bacterium]|jgi:hypothetical protein|nr:hypothetical protein [Chthoniobacteraceae bacterium]